MAKLDKKERGFIVILYVDETENDNYFILAGLLAESRISVDSAYNHFKKRIRNYPIKERVKGLVYREFKSTVLDRHYQKIKSIMLEEIELIDNHFVVYSTHIKKDVHLTQSKKEEIYIDLIIKIVKSCGNISVVYDGFNNPKFESKIENELMKINNVDVALAKDSQEEAGLQFADNLCSVIRLYISGADKYNFYKKISSKVIEI